jgi:antitoxin component YwqK of YwqJK toxin-antitoxin module
MVEYENLEITYHSTGSVSFVSEIDPVTGEWNGIIAEWYTNGLLREVSFWKNDEPYGLFRTWHPNGVNETSCNYTNGLRHGTLLEWHDNGILSEKSQWVNGKLHGDINTWYDNGNAHQVAKCVNGEYHGHVINFTKHSHRLDLFYCNGVDITHEIEKIVKDINNITTKEKTLIALQFGFVL